jgi:hypothetical protein
MLVQRHPTTDNRADRRTVGGADGRADRRTVGRANQ